MSGPEAVVRETLDLGDAEMVRAVLGPSDANLRALREVLRVSVSVREARLTVEGEAAAVRKAVATAGTLMELVAGGVTPAPADVRRLAGSPEGSGPVESPGDRCLLRVFGANRYVRPRGAGQAAYLAALQAADIVFATGPAGTGKTYLAVAFAAACLESGRCDRLILSRPAVEAGERLGFLPGDMREKVDPYLRPLYDALYDVLPPERVERELATDVIEIAPLAFMRGRTLSNAIIILDEAQNCTPVQMKMFLTRLGDGSKMIVTGDPSQVDLPAGKDSGLVEAIGILNGIDEIAHIAFTAQDVVRRELVGKIVNAYEAAPRRGAPHG